MIFTPTTLTRAAGLAAVAGGLLFIAVQFKHPLLTTHFTTTTEYVAGFVLPGASGAAPGYVNDVIVAAFGGKASGDIGSLGTVFAATGICYVLGGLLFGIATFRAGILWRWAAVLLAVGNVSTLALSVLPGSFNRPMAVPTGVALIGLGVSLWRDQRREAVRSSAEPAASGAPEASGTAPVVAPHAQAAVR
jgi:hypothetical protein